MGKKANAFSLSIRLDKAKNLHNLLPIPPADNENVVEAWLSYRLLDATLIQTEKFEIYATRTEGFEASEDVFKLELPATGNLTAALSKSFDVYLCTHGSILGRLEVNISRLLTLNEGGDQFAERAGRGTFYFGAAANGKEDDDESSDASSIEVTVSLSHELNDGIAADICSSSSSSSNSRTCKLEATTTTTSCQTKPAVAQHPKAAPPPTQTQTPSPSTTRTAGTTADDRIEFEKERRRWEEWRHKEELKWHNKMRERESAALKALDEQSKAQERDNAKEIDVKKKEFENLEGRLRKALAEVEKRERRIRTVEASREAEYTTKMAEVELKQKLLKEETKHTAELEQVKVRAANERAAAAEKATAVAEERTRSIEVSFEAFKKAHRESHEGLLQKEISALRGELVAAESRINKTIQEKNEAIFEKEQHRASVHKLAKALKREKAKVQSMEDKERKQFLLEKKRHCLETSTNREELKRITLQLQGIENSDPSIATDADASSAKNSSTIGTIPSPLTPPRHPLSKENNSPSLPTGVLVGAMALGAHILSRQTPPSKVWNGTTIDTTRHVASDSKLHTSSNHGTT